MKLSSQNTWAMLGFGLVMGNIFISWIAAIVVGGFKVGSLERRVTYPINSDQYAGFWQRMQLRLAEIGFRPGHETGVFTQSAQNSSPVTAFTHAKTKKELRATAFEENQGITVELTLKYLDPIVGDSGESAYRDAVLDYVSGTTDAMKVVPNRSFGAMSCLIGGVLAWVALIVLKFIGFRPVLPPMLMLTMAGIGTGIFAIIAIRSKPGELTGMWLAIVGIALSALVVLVAIVFEVMNHF